MKPKVKIFLRGDYSIDAIDYYTKLLANGISESVGYDIETINTVNDLNSEDIVIALDAKSHFFVWWKNNKIKVFSWFQGVLPEENKMNNPNFNIINFLRIKWWEILERFSLKKSYCNVFVSDNMRRHYSEKYNVLLDKNNLIIPCYNKIFNPSVIKQDRYNEPTFVYAGSLAGWQCVEETLSLFKLVKETIRNAKLTLLTNERERAEELLKKYNLEEVTIKYVPYDKVDSELQKFKYGFILRKQHIVNEVSTPTKINTYIANGVIPISTNAIGFYRERFKSLKHIIVLNSNLFDSEIENSQSILEFEKLKINEVSLKNDFELFCNTNFNDELYKEKVKEIFN